MQGLLQVQQRQGLPGEEARRAVRGRPSDADRDVRRRARPHPAAGAAFHPDVEDSASRPQTKQKEAPPARPPGAIQCLRFRPQRSSDG
jgi:hypothetical protein